MPQVPAQTPALRESERCNPPCFEHLVSVVVAQVAPDGRLLQGNRGLWRLLGAGAPPPDLHTVFVNPTLAQLLQVQAPAGQPVFEGILNLRDAGGSTRSLTGTVHQCAEGVLLLVAEFDIQEMERLTAEVLALNNTLIETQHELARSNRALKASEERLRELSLTDPLTGLANRRRLMDMLDAAVRRARRYGVPLSVVALDIDHFKHINDTYGHDAGDVVLQGLAQQMQDMVRKTDLTARSGGEEFFILLADTPLERALGLAQRLRQAAARLRFESIPEGITCSYGVAQYQPDDSVETLLQRADQALYQSKNQGRDQVTAAPDSP